MPRTSSYLQHIARRPAGALPLLQPPRALTRRWEVTATQDVVSKITPSLARQRSLAVSSGPDTSVASLQTSVQRLMEQPSTPAMKEEVEALLEANSSPATRLASVHTNIVPANIPPVIEDGTDSTPTTRHQKPQEEIHFTPVKSGKLVSGVTSEADQSLPIAQSDSSPRGSASSEEQRSRVVLRPNGRQESSATTTASTSTRARRSDDTAHAESDVITKTPARHARVTLVPQTQVRPTASPSKQETQQRSSVHIGSIDIHIVQLPTPPAPTVPVPSPAARGTPGRSRAVPALSRELTSSVGLRQG